jgi:hypothetical protein
VYNAWGREPIAIGRLQRFATETTLRERPLASLLPAKKPATGKKVWEVPSKAPNWSGVLSTGGGVVFTGTSTQNGTSYLMTGKMELHFIPGSMHSLTCMTEAQYWDLASATFDDIFKSYEPMTAALIASISPRGGSVLTMFAGHRYDGVAHVLSQDTPNLPAAGWVPTAGSLLVDGGGVWQVCEGVNYAGTCRAVSVSQSAEVGSLFEVNSARRLSGPQASASAAATARRSPSCPWCSRRCRRRAPCRACLSSRRCGSSLRSAPASRARSCR